MKKVLSLALLGLLLLGGGYAVTQNINKALQLSQDATGAFGVDTNNNVYFPGHILSTGPGTPTLTACGTGTPVIAGTDTAGVVTMGTSATGCVITFAKAYASVPWCVVSWQATPLASQLYTVTATAITTIQTSASANKLNYVCSSAS